MPNSLAAVYQYDDGGSELGVGFGDGIRNAQALWFNQFNVIAGQNTIASTSIAWGTPTNSTPAERLNGIPITAAIWSDPDSDGDPSDAVLLSSVAGVISAANTDRFITYIFPSPVTITGSSFFIGNMTPRIAMDERLIESLDETTSAGKSWVAGMNDGSAVDIEHIGNNTFLGTIDSFGLPGNWLIRADGPLSFTSAFSEKNGFAIDLPFDGSGVEDRSGGSNGEYALYFMFNTPLASIGSATTSCGSVASFEVDPDDVHQAEVDLTAVDCNANEITVTVTGLVDTFGNTLASASVTFGLLIGDVNADRVVTKVDYHAVKIHEGERTDNSNFRADVSAKEHGLGHIDVTDLRLVKSQIGTRLP